MTFFEGVTNKFGALGHPITDITTNITIPVKDGSIVSSKVLSILPGKSGTPGEIRGIFYNEDKTLGHLSKNTENGIFGKLTENLKNEQYSKPLEIALQNEVKVGPAKILTTLEDKVESFDVYIEEVNKQTQKDGKGMVVRVTDERLLKETGGIIQGMSGSPIIQDEKIVGAITHVFVNDPTKGYGIFIEWMLDEAGLVVVE
jgi:stage IV sporulation protein B